MKIFYRLCCVIVLTVCFMGVLTGCDKIKKETKHKRLYRTVEEIQKSGKVKIGVFSDKNPFGYVDEHGKYQGYDIYFAERIGKDLGVDVEYVATDAAVSYTHLDVYKRQIMYRCR